MILGKCQWVSGEFVVCGWYSFPFYLGPNDIPPFSTVYECVIGSFMIY